jgi:hypothetical protein
MIVYVSSRLGARQGATIMAMSYLIPAIIASIALTSLVVSIKAYRNGGGRAAFKCEAEHVKEGEFKANLRVINVGRGDMTVDFIGFEANYFYGDKLKSNLIRVNLEGVDTPCRLVAKSHEDWSYTMSTPFAWGLTGDGYTYAVFEVGGVQQRARVKVKEKTISFRKEFDLREPKEINSGKVE